MFRARPFGPRSFGGSTAHRHQLPLHRFSRIRVRLEKVELGAPESAEGRTSAERAANVGDE